MMSSSGPNFKLAGYRKGSSTNYAGMFGYYWSSTASSNNYAYRLSLDSSDAYPAYDDSKYVGLTVRCINVN